MALRGLETQSEEGQKAAWMLSVGMDALRSIREGVKTAPEKSTPPINAARSAGINREKGRRGTGGTMKRGN
jgi:hypothetical protein